MSMEKRILWKVPLFCICAGVIVFYGITYLLGRFMTIALPDGSITSDNTRVLITYGVMFILTLGVGGMVFFRNMTQKEIFFSASIIVAIGLIVNLIQLGSIFTTDTSPALLTYAFLAFEWSSIVPQLLFRLNVNLWIGTFIGILTPYLFILFGKRRV